MLPLKRPKDAKKLAGVRQEWQTDAWEYFDEVPEVKQATWFLGNSMAKLRLFIAQVPDGDDDPMPADAEGATIAPEVVAAAKAELGRLRGGLAGAGEILRDANMNFEVAGEGYLVGWAARDEVLDPFTQEVKTEAEPERWEIRSISEVEIKGSGKSTRYVVKDDPGDKGRPLNPDTDTIIRLYQPHPRWSSLSDCAMRGVLAECEALVVLHRQVIAEGNSRASAGILTVPNELGLGPVEKEGTEDGQEAKEDPFLDDLSDATVEPIDDPGHPSATTPMLVRGPAEYLKPDVFRHMTLQRPAAEGLDARIEARVMRLARGLNLPVEKVMGHQQTTYANAEQVDQNEFDEHLEPRAVLLVNALTTGFLRSQLRDESSQVRAHPDVDRVMVWFDPRDLIRQPDLEAGADRALEQNAISLAAYRKAKGWTEDDAPTEEELLQRAGLRRGILTADLTLALLHLLGQAGADLEVKPIGTPMPQPVGPDGELLPSPADQGGDPGSSAPADAPADGATPDQQMAALMGDLIREAFNRGDTLGAQRLILAELDRRGIDAARALPAEAIAATGRVATPVGRQLMDLDRDLRTRLLVAADASMRRALDRAGARIRSKLSRSTKGLMAQVPSQELARRIGREGVAELAVTPEDLLADSWDTLRDQFMAWGESAQAEALELAAQTVAGFTEAERAALKLRQAADLDEAWNWLEQHLRGYAQEQLFAPDAEEVAGELVEALSVPPGMLRQALARAGGATIETTGIGGEAWTAITNDGRAVGGIGTGDLILGALADHGAGREGYRWVYGAAVRKQPFEPHVALDGVEFENFDDEVLANTSGFPDLPYYMPGDHGGCICDFEPIIMSPEEG